MPLPPFPPGKRSVMLTRASWQTLRDELDAGVQPDPTEFVTERKGKKIWFRNRRTPELTRAFPGSVPPFLPILGTDDDGETYYVTVTPGVVYERIIDNSLVADADAVKPWTCPSQYDGGDLAKLPIADGEAVFVMTRENGDGRIGATAPDEPVDLVVLDKATKSQNFIPGTQAGIYYYQLAYLTITDGVPDLTIVRGGSHIDRDSGLTGDMLLEDCSGDQYETPPVSGNILLRASFTSGRLVGLNLSEATRPLSANTVREQVEPCSGTGEGY